MTVTVEQGCYYVTRDGEIAGPMEVSRHNGSIGIDTKGRRINVWTESGREWLYPETKYDRPTDLMEKVL